MDNTSVKKVCCFCGKAMEKYRDFHNPYPLRDSNMDCCDECNRAYVIPARRTIAAWNKQEQEAFEKRVKQMDLAKIREVLAQGAKAPK